MKRITAVFPTRAEAEATYAALRRFNLAQGAISLLADSSAQVNTHADDSRSSDKGLDLALESPVIAPIAAVGGLSMGVSGGIGNNTASAYAVTALVDAQNASRDSSALTSSTRAVRAADLLNGENPHQNLLEPDRDASSGPLVSATLEGFIQAGFATEEAEYYSSAVSQGHAVLSVQLEIDEQEAGVRQIISQNEGHPYMGRAQ